MAPEISILMTAFNAQRYLREAIDSILQQQTARSWELVFVNDGSTDRTFAIASEYAFRFPGVVRVVQHRGGLNRGISASRNAGTAARPLARSADGVRGRGTLGELLTVVR